MGIVRVGVILGGNFLRWGFSGWELSVGNNPSGSFPSTKLSLLLALSKRGDPNNM